MPIVETVLGPVDPSELGVTLAHEHVVFYDEGVRANWPTRYDRDQELATALDALADAKDRGVQTLFDATAMFAGRNISFIREVSERSGLHIAACTGIYTYDHLPHYFMSRDEDAIAAHFVDDIRVGIEGTDIKAAFLKCAADAPGVTPNIEKVHRAVARAHVETGAPIMAHSMPAQRTADRQIEIFEEEGVDLSRVVIAHCGDTDDVDYIESLLAKGVYAGLDRYGLEMFLPIDRRNATLAELIRRGHAERLHVAQDLTPTIDWFPPEVQEQMLNDPSLVRNWSYTLAFDEVVPWLREQGVLDDDVFHTLFVENPRRWIADG